MTRLLVVVLGAACKPVAELPEDLDGNVHWLWDHHPDEASPALFDAVVSLDAAMGADALTTPTDGSLSRLAKEDAEALGITDRDPANAAAIFLGNLIACDLPTVVEIFTHPEQDRLYPGIYTSYTRTYHGDVDAYLRRDIDTLTWSLDYGASVLGSAYTGHTEALLRRVVPDDDDAPFAEAHIVRFFAPNPAVFGDGSNKSFEQDYQFEVYWTRRDGETLHAYAMWREAGWGSGFTSENEGVQRILLNNMAKWDDDTAKLCEAGGP